MGRLRFYAPRTKILSLDDFPTSLRGLACRVNFAGTGQDSSPFLMGWKILPGKASQEAEPWIKEQGFTKVGNVWCLQDDEADEMALRVSPGHC